MHLLYSTALASIIRKCEVEVHPQTGTAVHTRPAVDIDKYPRTVPGLYVQYEYYTGTMCIIII
jgi:hypothetical protein